MLSVILGVLLLICGIWITWRRRNTNKNEPPTYPGALPFIGHTGMVIGSSKKLWTVLKKVSDDSVKLGGVLSFRLGPKIYYLISDPEDSMKIANTCLDKGYFYKFSKPWLGDGILNVDAPVWKSHRKLLNPAFNQTVLDGYLDVFNRQARKLTKDLEVEVGRGPFDHRDYILHNAVETICHTALGVDFGDKSSLKSKYVHAIDDFLEIIILRIKSLRYHVDFIFKWTTLKKKQDECVNVLHNMSNSVLKERIANFNNINNIEDNTKEPKFKSFMDILLELHSQSGVFSYRQIREQVDTVMFAGHDTVASTLLFTMVLIGSFPDVQEKVSVELDNVFGEDDRDVTKQDLSQLVYLDAVIKESLRFYPVAPVVARYLDHDVKLRNCTLPKGELCLLSLYGLLRHPSWGPDVEQFKPERWLDPATLPANVTSAVFSVGKRNCIGKQFSYMSMKTTLAHLCRSYRISGDHRNMEVRFDVLLRPISGYHISLEKRK